jgi:hypothetical protein
MNSGGVALNGAWFWVGWVFFLSWTLEGLAQVEFPGDADGDAVGEESLPLPPPRVEVEVMFLEELARVLPTRGAWLPVYVELRSTDGATHSVRIEGSVRNGVPSRVSFRADRVQEVAPGAPVRTWLYLRLTGSEEGMHSIALRVLAGGRPILEREWRAQASLTGLARVGILVLGDALGDVTPWTGRLSTTHAPARIRRFGSPQLGIEHAVQSVSLERLPDNIRGYDACDVVVLQQPDESVLEPAQVRALDAWVRLGGLVVVLPDGGSDAVFSHAIVKELLGERLGAVQLEEGVVLGRLRAVDPPAEVRWETEVSERPEQESATAPIRLDPVPPEVGRRLRRIESVQEVRPGVTQTRRVYMEFPHGRGAVGVLPFDSRKLIEKRENHQLLRDLWGGIVRWRLERATSRLQRHWVESQSETVVRELRDESRDIGLSFLVGLIVVYLLLVGPLLYVYLKKRGRLLALVWAEPLVALVYVGVVFGVGYLTKGVLTKTEQWTLYKQVAGESFGSRESYLSIFAADEGAYDVEAADADFLLTVNAREVGPHSSLVLSTDGQQRQSLAGFHLELWQQGFVIGGKLLRFEADGVELTSVGEGEAERVVARNRLAYPIRSGLVYWKDDVLFVLPRLAVGEEAELKLSASEDGVHGEWTKELIQRVRSRARLGYGVDGGHPRVMALLEREVEDLQLDRPHTVKARHDVYLLFPEEV